MFKKFFIVALVFIGFFTVEKVNAQVITHLPSFRDLSFQGSFISQSEPDPLHITAGEKKTVVVRLKNTGKASWEANGKNFVSIYTVDPHYHTSLFAGGDWRENDSPAKLNIIVKPGGIGEFSVVLTAPTNPGEYVEKFYLAAENKTWIKGTGFYFKIIVDKNDQAVSALPSTPVGANQNTIGNIVDPLVQPLTRSDSSTTTLAASTASDSLAPSAISYDVLTTRVLVPEPTIRVGLFKSSDPIKFQSSFQYQVFAQDEFLGMLDTNQVATLSYSNGTYTVSSAGFSSSSTKYIRLIPLDPTNYFVLPEYSRPYSAYEIGRAHV